MYLVTVRLCLYNFSILKVHMIAYAISQTNIPGFHNPICKGYGGSGYVFKWLNLQWVQ